jgi:hypothetical protein
MKIIQITLGVLFVGLGAAMLFLTFRDGSSAAGSSWLAPLGLIGAGALSISHARRKPKKW